jgi:Ferritin-like
MAPVPSRSQLLTLLTEACELEHGLACSYLYSAFTLKQELHEGGITWRQLQMVRLWAAQIYFIAAQEMLHLAQVWNMQAAIGGTPYYLRPNFPQPPRYYPLNLPLRLERFSLAALDRFIQYERPASVIVRPENPLSGPAEPAFKTVGELYELIRSGFENIPEKTLFVGYPDRQVGADLVDFPDLVKVTDRASAVEAIRRITHQGEGVDDSREDCHFGLFRAIRRNYLLELAAAEQSGETFAPVRMSISNPVADAALHLGVGAANLITDERTREVADCFDSIYGMMLRMLQYVFDNATSHETLLHQFGRRAIELMAAVIKPLGEALTLMPAGPDYED